MENYEYYRDLLPAFLNGETNDDERRAIEKALTSDPRLATDLRELRQLLSGLTIMDTVEGDHIAVELLVTYADNPERLGKTERTALAQHIENCDECRDELAMCRGPVGLQEPSVGLIRNIWERLTQPRSVSPVWGAVVLILLVLPVIYISNQGVNDRGEVSQSFRVRAGVSRGVEQQQTLELDPDAALVSLEIVLPTLKHRSYGAEVYNRDDGLLTAVYLLEPTQDNLISVSLARSILPDGQYKVKIIEYDSNAKPTESFEFTLRIYSGR